MYICIYVYMDICIYVYMYICIYVNMCICICMYIYIYICICICICMKYVCVYIYTFVYVALYQNEVTQHAMVDHHCFHQNCPQGLNRLGKPTMEALTTKLRAALLDCWKRFRIWQNRDQLSSVEPKEYGVESELGPQM